MGVYVIIDMGMMELVSKVTVAVIDMDISLLNNICYSYLGFSLVVFLVLVAGITAPYGRYTRNGWGIFINAKVAWFLQELPSFAIPLILICTGSSTIKAVPNVIFITLFLIHYVHRSFIYPLLIKGGKPMPFITFMLAFIFCTVNGYLQSMYILHHAYYDEDWWVHPHIWIGIVMFITGMAINIHSDNLLRNLRKPGESGYKIPIGGLFTYVSGANFLGEMIEWTGFAIATWGFPALAFAFSTCCNIGPRAWQHHWYYLSKFEDYPKDRKAIIPFML